MASFKERLSARVTRVRERRPIIDHLVRMQEHYGTVKAGQQAGAVTYFGFLSFFPILALSFAVVGWIAKVYPDARDTTVEAVESIFPGMIGGDNGIALADIEAAAGAAVGFGLLGVLYAGLGWLSSLRDALLITFELPDFERPNFVMGKLRDLITLAAVGITLLLSVAISGVVSGGSEKVLEWLGLGVGLRPLLWVLGVVIGLLASTVLFLALFRLLADPHTPKRSLLSGALVGAVGFEALKLLSSTLLRATKEQPAFQAFGIALILVVWINYFSRVVLYAAAWAHTSPAARAARVEEPVAVQGPQVPSLTDLPATSVAGEHPTGPRSWKGPFIAGAGAMLALTAVMRKKEEHP
ncbi:YihY/virulence factor BrkB family protein [Nocardioides sp. cx-169]|uniref:YihY/virulence factor BrkB family protein n=1 Tax=Nocardioides sp. cx-169 TaxID=2899080 RepID=UPI001E2CCBD2|nr:YihY/virulence factor BrkB family protein [Nocardioides sp. cx-169]MCD4535786.1 YihY/virulence factor BrkB family protein [Nocardioides sp. cx-169]